MRKDINCSRSPYSWSLVKGVFFAAIVVFLSNVSPSFSEDFDLTKTSFKNANDIPVAYPQSIFSAYNDHDSDKKNYLTALNVALNPKKNDSDDYPNSLPQTFSGVSDYNPILTVDSKNLLARTLDTREQYSKNSLISPLSFVVDNPGVPRAAQSDENIIDVSNILQSDSAQGLQRNAMLQRNLLVEARSLSPESRESGGQDAIAIGSNAQSGYRAVALGYNAYAKAVSSVSIGPFSFADGNSSIALGNMAHSWGVGSVAIGGVYEGGDNYTTAQADYTTALGSLAKAFKQGAIAVGYLSNAYDEYSIALGYDAIVEGIGSMAIGANSMVTADAGVVIGKDSVSDRDSGVSGYSSIRQGSATGTEMEWKSTRGAVSVGDNSKKITRQITGIAAGSEATDAVNVKQLQDLESVVRNSGWKLSVGGKNGQIVSMDSVVDFSAGSANLQITKGDRDNKLKFDLAKDITLNSAKMRDIILDATGLVITNGPQITIAGISAGNKEIKDIKAGEISATSQQAVNGSQLYSMGDTVAKY
ncbi:hypothetical protein NPX99_08490, partial [Bartonella sp. 220]|nr:hypothetical protein [Bartonella sp. 220B]